MANKGFNSKELRDALAKRGALPADYKAPPPGSSSGKKPDIEGQFLANWRLLCRGPDRPHLYDPERQYKFHPDRAWRFDFAFVGAKVAVECQGGIWVNGGHTRGRQYQRDREKIWTAQTMGWIVCEVTDVEDCRLMDSIRAQIAERAERRP